MDHGAEDVGTGGYQSKTQSLRDKMKKRRQAIESLLTGEGVAAATGEAGGETVGVLEKKRKSEDGKVLEEEKVEYEGTSLAASPPAERCGGVPDDLTALLSMQSAKEREERSQQEEIFTLLSKPTAREQSLLNTFKSADGGGVKEFCQHSTKAECCKVHQATQPCDKLHFVKILQQHTDESLGDCSFLNTCFHMDTCKYIHYEVDKTDVACKVKKDSGGRTSIRTLESTKLVPPQWVQCDLRNLKFEVLGKFSVLMADPPWDIHMELPYGTMSDDEMRRLPVPDLQVSVLYVSSFINSSCRMKA